MSELEGLTAPGYPERESKIALDVNAGDFGLIEGAFQIAMHKYGDGDSVTWPSFTDSERFQIYSDGESATQAEGRHWPVWLLVFEKEQKIMRFSIADYTIERLEGEEFVEASFKDVSDLVAAYFNLAKMLRHPREQEILRLHAEDN